MGRRVRGFTLIETLVASAVMVMFMAAVGQMVQISADLVARSKTNTIATSLAQDQLELVHNLAFANVGTVGGIPPGDLEQEKTVRVGVTDFTVKTNVTYVDDPFDGLAPIDTLPIDYKRVRVEASWGGPFASADPVKMWSDVAPKGVESIAGAGTLSVLVFDSQGQPVEGAAVHVKADAVTPTVDLNTVSDENGRVLLPGALVCVECYEIDVTKSGYTSERTYSTTEVANPAKPHVTILEGEVTEVSFAIDVVSSTTFKAVRTNYTPFPGVQMRVYGGKLIGTTIDDDPVYKYDELVVTAGLSGQVTVYNMEWDNYTVELPGGSSVDFAGSMPLSPFALSPGSVATFTMVVDAASANTLLVRMLDELAAPVASGSVELTHSLTQAVSTKSAAVAPNPDQGQVFFSGLDPVAYLIRAMSEGFADATASVQVVGDIVETIQMESE